MNAASHAGEPGERGAFLAEACRSDEELRREAESLLAQDSSAGPMERPAMEVAADLLGDSTVDQMQRNFRPMVEAVETWRGQQLLDEAAKLLIYRAFVEGELDVPRHLARSVHDLYFNPQCEEFQARTVWSLLQRFYKGV